MNPPLIIVVDDDQDYLNMMQLLLAVHGYRTEVQNRAAGSHPFICAEQPILVIVDMRMEQPESGLMLVLELRADPRTAHIPVLVCSAEHNLHAKVHDLQIEDCDSLKKPFKPERLLAKIEELVKV